MSETECTHILKSNGYTVNESYDKTLFITKKHGIMFGGHIFEIVSFSYNTYNELYSVDLSTEQTYSYDNALQTFYFIFNQLKKLYPLENTPSKYKLSTSVYDYSYNDFDREITIGITFVKLYGRYYTSVTYISAKYYKKNDDDF